MDLSRAAQLAVAEERGIEVSVTDEAGTVQTQENGEPHTITVVGSLSKRYQKVKARNRGRVLNAPTNTTLTDEEAGQQSFDQQTQSVAECVTDWTPGAFTDGTQPLSCTVPNAVKVLQAFPWLQARLERTMDDHARFFGATSSGSNG